MSRKRVEIVSYYGPSNVAPKLSGVRGRCRCPTRWRGRPLTEHTDNMSLSARPCSYFARRTASTIKVILREDIEGTGYKGEMVEVRGGFMRNYLFPTRRAAYASEENKKLYETLKRVSTYSKPMRL